MAVSEPFKFLRLLERGESVGDVSRDFRRACGVGCRSQGGDLWRRPIEVEHVHVAECLMPDDFPAAERLSPRTTYGDGNCLFRAASFLATGSGDSHILYRLLVVFEWGTNAEFHSAAMANRARLTASRPESLSAQFPLQMTLCDIGDACFLRCIH